MEDSLLAVNQTVYLHHDRESLDGGAPVRSTIGDWRHHRADARTT